MPPRCRSGSRPWAAGPNRCGGRSLGAVLCVSGLLTEAKIARAAGFAVVVGAGDRERTAALVEAAAAQADWLVSFGIAGGLDPALCAGAVVASGEVVGADRRWRVDALHRETIGAFARRIGAVEGAVFGAAAILASAAAKDRAWKATRALAVDLESDIVARIAARRGIPFIVLRAIADTAGRRLPPAALLPLAADGRPDLDRVLAEILRRPSQIADVIALARAARRALRALVGPARTLGDTLAA
jgi:adenosylhomocysteine nucleosidase